MASKTIKNTYSISWWNNLILGLISFLFSAFMKALIAVVYLLSFMKKIALGLLFCQLLIVSMILLEGKASHSIILASIILFPFIKVVYLGYNYIREGRITKKRANILYLFVSFVFITLLTFFLMNLVDIHTVDMLTSIIILPIFVSGFIFVLFEVGKILVLNSGVWGRASDTKEEEKVETVEVIEPVKLTEEDKKKNLKTHLEQLTSYRRNVAGHIPFNSNIDLL